MGSARRDWPWAARNMATESEGNLRLEIGHVLFIDRGKRVIAYYRNFVFCYLAHQGHFFGSALYLDRSRDARPLPRGLAGYVAHPLRSILHRGLPGAALGKPGRSFTRVTALAHERPRRLVIGHVLLRRYARRVAADRFSPKPRRRLP